MVVSQRPAFVPRLSFKLTLPYVLLAIVLALATLYILARTQASNVTTEFSRQLADARVRVGDSVVQTERLQIDHVRTLAHVKGLASAARARDVQSLYNIIKPFAVSQRIERIVVTDQTGHPLSGIDNHDADVAQLATNLAIATWPSVMNVLHGVSDAQGDKYVEMVDDNGTQVIYTVAPVYDNTTLVGALLVGTSVRTLVERWRGATLADVTLYSDSGVPVASSLGAEPPKSLADSERDGRVFDRNVTIGSRDYTEIVSALPLRGVSQPQFIGVALSTAGLDNLFEDAQYNLLPIFGLGLISTFLLGILLAQRITRPITALVTAAEGVAAGDLNHVLPVTTRDEIGALTKSFNTMIGGLRERERMHDILGRFVSPTVARLVLSHPLDLSGETKLLTILFTDLRDFTVISEKEEPATVIKSLNHYFQIVVDAADRHGGVVNKFGGDSTLVLFGLTDEQDNPQGSAESAVRAAMAIRNGLDELNSSRAAEGLAPLLAGIGINTGTVVAGLIGTERRMEYTAIGDAVNLSARIQTLNRKLGTEILISEATYIALGTLPWLEVVPQGLRRLKGKSKPVRVYEIARHQEREVEYGA